MPPPQRGPGIHNCRRQRLQPIQYRNHSTTKMKGNTLSVYQPLSALNIIGGGSMPKGFKRKSIVFIPLAGADVQFVHATFFILCPCGGGKALLESLPQQIRKEMVITVPAPLVVQRDDEQVGAFKIFQGFLAGTIRVEQNRITQGATQTVEDGGTQQESLNSFGLLVQDFFNQVVHHEMVAAGE